MLRYKNVFAGKSLTEMTAKNLSLKDTVQCLLPPALPVSQLGGSAEEPLTEILVVTTLAYTWNHWKLKTPSTLFCVDLILAEMPQVVIGLVASQAECQFTT